MGPEMIFQNPSDLFPSNDLTEVKNSEFEAINDISDDFFNGMNKMVKNTKKNENFSKSLKNRTGNFSKDLEILRIV